jgi:hypothetical protein
MGLKIYLVLSVILQIAAAVMAIRLIKVTGRRVSWILIAIAISGMAVRRVMSLSWLFSGGEPHPLDIPFEFVGLLTSLFMLAGIFYIKPLFLEIKQAEEKREKLLAELQDALANIKVLKGFLPMCAWCKKIRDDEGYWKQVEDYISKRTEAEFTHGICPQCLKKVQEREDT